MNLPLWECPLCKGTLIISLGSFPYGQARNNDTFDVTCPLCSGEFQIGFVSEFRKSKPSTDSTQQHESSSGDSVEPRPLVGGGGSVVHHNSEGPSHNDQQSNVRNPNNPAFKASRNNRSNQMNPNNPAYRSGRGRAAGR